MVRSAAMPNNAITMSAKTIAAQYGQPMMAVAV
jgi:hypothetical protein